MKTAWTSGMDQLIHEKRVKGHSWGEVTRFLNIQFGADLTKSAVSARYNRKQRGLLGNRSRIYSQDELDFILWCVRNGKTAEQCAGSIGRSAESVRRNASRQGEPFSLKPQASGDEWNRNLNDAIDGVSEAVWLARSKEGTRKLGRLLQKHHPEMFSNA